MTSPAKAGEMREAADMARREGKAIPMAELGRRMRAPAGEAPESPPADDQEALSSSASDDVNAESSTAQAETAEAAPAKRRGKGSDARIQQLLSERKKNRLELDALRRQVAEIQSGSARKSREDAFAALLGTAPTQPASAGEATATETSDAVQTQLQKARGLAAVQLARDEIEDDHPDIDAPEAREAAKLLAVARLRGVPMTSTQAVAAARATLDEASEEETDADTTDDDAGEVPARSRSTRSNPAGRTGVTRAERTPDAQKAQELSDVRKQLLNPRLHPSKRASLNARLWTLTGRG